MHVLNCRTVKLGNNSLRVLDAHIWNSLPENIKTISSKHMFRNFVKTWYGPLFFVKSKKEFLYNRLTLRKRL